MGYKRQRKIYKLRFEDPEFEGLEVRTRSTSTRQFLDIQGMASAAQEKEGDSVTAMRTLFQTFATVILDWNLEDENGTPIPVSAEALMDEDFDFVMSMVLAWLEAQAGVPAPLDGRSTNGSPILEGSLAMEPLSTSLAS